MTPYLNQIEIGLKATLLFADHQ